jgi:transcriptional regulator with XRE-family HTH domain
MDKIIKIIEEANTEKGISDNQFAKEVGIDAGAWSRIRRGQRKMPLSYLRKIAQKRKELALDIQNYIFSADEKEAVDARN